MADLTATATNVRELDAVTNRRITLIASVAITRGQALYVVADGANKGKAALALGDDVTTSKVCGIATSTVAAGEPVDALFLGRMVGWAGLGDLDADTTIYLSEATAGALADTAPSTATEVIVPLGRVYHMTDVSATPYIYFDIPQAMATPTAIPA